MPERLRRIEVIRHWRERHAHHELKLAEDEGGGVWLRVDDLRHWMPGLPSDQALAQRLPMLVARADGSRCAWLAYEGLVQLTRKSQSPATLKLVHWLQGRVVLPAQRRREAAVLCGTDAGSEMPRHVERPAWWQSGPDPRDWLIAQGRHGPWHMLAVGTGVSLLLYLLSVGLQRKTWDVENAYVTWLWLAVLAAGWGAVWTAAWSVGAVRHAATHAERNGTWPAVGGATLNLVAAAALGFGMLLNLGGLLPAWWSHTVRAVPPAAVQAVADADGVVRRLRISGALGVGSTRALHDALRQHPQVNTLEIESPGGLYTEGRGMAQLALMRSLNTRTRVRCDEACTLVFVAGERRLAERDASLGVFDAGWATRAVVADFYRQRGVPEDFVQRTLGRTAWTLQQARSVDAAAADSP